MTNLTDLSRNARIALASQVTGVRSFLTDMDHPTLASFEVSGPDYDELHTRTRKMAESLVQQGFAKASSSNPTRTAGTWLVATVTVDLGV